MGVRHVTQLSADPAGPAGKARRVALAANGNGSADADGAGQAGVIEGTLVAGSSASADATSTVQADQAARPRSTGPSGPGKPTGPVERLMSTVIRRLSSSRLSEPRVALSVAAVGLLLGIIVGATAPNSQTLQYVWLPLTNLVSALLDPQHRALPPGVHDVIPDVILFTGDALTCLGLAGMLWAHSQGWRPDPRRLLLASVVVVAIMVCLTPVGSSDTASYAAYGRIAALGYNPYSANAMSWLNVHDPAYWHVVVYEWKNQPSVYGPVATWIQSLAASIGGASVQTTIWVLMIFNGLVFLAVGVLLLKTSDDPVRATLLWTANPILLQILVGGGHFDTFIAAAAIAAIQLARRTRGVWSDVLIGLVIGLGCGVKAPAVLIGLGLAWPLLRQPGGYLRVGRIALAAIATVGLEYSFYGVGALKPLFSGAQWVALPSPWWFVQWLGGELGLSSGSLAAIIGCLWLVSLVVVAWLVYRRISSDEPPEVVAPFALSYAWILIAPRVLSWYTALPWVMLTQMPRNRITRWLTIVTFVLAVMHSNGGWVPPGKI
jgi:hypothetical protein